MTEYRTRVAEGELATSMQAMGAVLIEGPKACGKTATALRFAASTVELDVDATAQASIDLNPSYLFDRPTPILFDEWQAAPEVWNHVRRRVDAAAGGRGLYLLTGSATPRDDVARHSGAGRIGTLRMRPMSLYESGHSSGAVSLAALFQGAEQRGGDSGLSVSELMERVVIGGWPDLLGATEAEARLWIDGYLRQIVEVDIPEFVGRRDPRTLRRVMASLARHVAHSPATRVLAADAGGDRGAVAPATIYSHLDALDRLHLLDNSEAWQPHMRSRTRLRSTPTRYFVDPSIGTALLGATSAGLLSDLNAAGYQFEALVVRDLRVYAQALHGRVDTWRDADGKEVDAVIALPDGRWGAIEIKLGQREVGAAAKNLRALANRVNTERHGEPSFLMVITATGIAGRRDDGVQVAPVTSLAP